LADQRAAAAETHAYLTSQRDLIAGQQRSLRETIDQLTNKTQHLAQFEAEVHLLNQKIEELDRKESLLSRDIGHLQDKIEPTEAALSAQESTQQALELEERAFQEKLRKDETAWNTAQLHYQRTDDLLHSLRHDIEQDLGLVLLEASEELAYQPPLPWDAIVEQLPPVAEITEGLEEDVREMRARLSRVSNVNPEAPKEYAETAGRHDYLLTQSADLEAAIADMRKVIRELDDIMEKELHLTFAAVSTAFVEFFQSLFSGGTAKLVLADPSDITNSGIEIVARPPGKRPQSLALLSGGERTLTALALVFAILRVSPTPFCVLDEVDAALDEANVDRFRHTLEGLSADTQFIIITHNRRTLEGTNAIYGITMGTDGASRIISLRFDGEQIVRRADAVAGGAGMANNGSAEDGFDELEELVKL
jgi:chromosome segregation protein